MARYSAFDCVVNTIYASVTSSAPFGRLCSSFVVKGSLLPDLGIKYAVEGVPCVSFPPGIVATFLQEDEPKVADAPRESGCLTLSAG